MDRRVPTYIAAATEVETYPRESGGGRSCAGGGGYTTHGVENGEGHQDPSRSRRSGTGGGFEASRKWKELWKANSKVGTVTSDGDAAHECPSNGLIPGMG